MSTVAVDPQDNIYKWPPETIFSFNIIKKSFNEDKSYYPIVKSCIVEAFRDWGRCFNLKFKYFPQYDVRPLSKGGSGPTNGVMFSIVYDELNDGSTYANAFFPETLKENLIFRIFPLFFQGLYDKTGLLKHEIGHILGLRHECEHPDSPCPHSYTDSFKPITVYDHTSIMHSLSDNLPTHNLVLSDLDRQGIRQLYGPPII